MLRSSHNLPADDDRRASAGVGPADRVRPDGKFFRLGNRRFQPVGFAYGPFAPDADGQPWPEAEQLARDLSAMAGAGATVARVYAVPPPAVLDAALAAGLRLLIDVPWPTNLAFSEDAAVRAAARRAVRDAAATAGRHAATFAISVANEIPADLARLAGPSRTERFIDDLLAAGRDIAPSCLFAYGNFPTTEYLRPRGVDFALFNVYLHDPAAFAGYLARLQNLAGDLPLVIGEYGVDTLREADEPGQAERLARHVRLARAEGCAGALIFTFTDDWHAHGHAVGDWAFGVVGADRAPKPALAALAIAFDAFAAPPLRRGAPPGPMPKVSVIVCTHNGAATLDGCLRSLANLSYADCETIVVDDGSTDAAPNVLAGFPDVRVIRIDRAGLSAARNAGLRAATGDVVAYTDDDCEADPEWVTRLVEALGRRDLVGVGGPNLVPVDGDAVAACVALAPGGPTHVMLDDRTAEHVPGCNMAFRRDAALAVGGFDPAFRAAGDDVDFIWRLRDAGGRVGFAPAAQVWHYRRNTVRAYLKQQRGYGRAEGMLRRKHPRRFNALGAPVWQGGVYGPRGREPFGPAVGGDRVYHGQWGTGLFQAVYPRPTPLAAALMTGVEWHALALLVALIGLFVRPLLGLAIAIELATVALCAAAALRAPRPSTPRWWSRPLLAYLHFRQPITRGLARYRAWLAPCAASGAGHVGAQAASEGVPGAGIPGAGIPGAGATDKPTGAAAPRANARTAPALDAEAPASRGTWGNGESPDPQSSLSESTAWAPHGDGPSLDAVRAGPGRDDVGNKRAGVASAPARDETFGARRSGALRFWWSHGAGPRDKDHRDVLARFAAIARDAGLGVALDDGWRRWDVRAGDRDGLWRADVLGATERHAVGRLALFRLAPKPTPLCLLLLGLGLAAGAAGTWADREVSILLWLIVLVLLLALAAAGGLLRWRVARLLTAAAGEEGFVPLP